MNPLLSLGWVVARLRFDDSPIGGWSLDLMAPEHGNSPPMTITIYGPENIQKLCTFIQSVVDHGRLP